ncbi:glycosyltransferase family 4 protein [Paenibacillus piri]|uniref:Glycosyltransferase family 1 protein n=1 Tax=Paenibacillus piri TaxID=2547395 RepID=A0A4R5KYT3_9BACL|nr:glycosyltransferase family 4 protein [Paenibacillus piri]TDG00308.1 glycosyltransferase family 1 protein [Paenibacillus piri]
MKVGIIMPLAGLHGGAEFMLLDLLRANKLQHQIDYTVVFFEPGPLVDEVKALGYPVFVLKVGKLRQLHRYASALISIYLWMKREKIDLVMSWMSKAHLYAAPAAMAAKVNAVWYQHGIPEEDDKAERLLARIPAKAVCCPSQAAQHAINRINPGLPTRVIYPSVDLEAFNPQAAPRVEEVRRQLGLPVDASIVGIIARLQRWKGVHVFIDAAAFVARVQPNAHFVIVGSSHHSEPEYPDELKLQAAKAGIADKVHFVGFQNQLTDWIQSFDILVQASVQEPFGMVVIEGMAMGKAVIATKAGGPKESIVHGENGMLVPPNDPASLASTIQKLIVDKNFYSRLSRAGMERAKAFSKERLSVELAEFFGNLNSGPQKRQTSVQEPLAKEVGN